MILAQCQPGDVVVIRGGLHRNTLDHLELTGETFTVRVGAPLAGGIGCDLVDDFGLEARRFADLDGEPRYGFVIAAGDTAVVEVVEPTKYPRGKRADDVGGRGADLADPMLRRRAGLV